METQNKYKTIIAVLLASNFIIAADFNERSLKYNILSFQENKGQVCDQNYKPRLDVLFSGTNGELVYHLKKDGISYQLTKVNTWLNNLDYNIKNIHQKKTEKLVPNTVSIYRMDLNWLNCNLNATIEKQNPIEGFNNFYSEASPNGALNVLSYKSLVYKNLYNGIDLKWYEKNGNLKYEYLVAPQTDYKQIKIELNGATKISVNSLGELIVSNPLGNIVEAAPIVIQDNKILHAKWKIDKNVVSFDIKDVDPSRSFIIDPLVKLWGTFYGGASQDFVGYICTDKSNNVIISGQTTSQTNLNIATTGAFQTTYGGAGVGAFPGDAFISKYNSNGVRQWSTYYGGNGCDFANNCVADASNNIYFVGGTTTTNSAVMTTPGCHQPVFGGMTQSNIGDAIIVKLDPNGARLWSTYYGDTSEDWALGASIDPLGNLFVCGGTWLAGNSTVFSTVGAYQPLNGGSLNASNPNVDAYLTKFSPSGQRIWSTYLGGTTNDNGHYCKNDANGNVYITGTTDATLSSIFSTSGSHQPNFSGGVDSYLVKFDNNGQRLWGTFYGGIATDVTANCTVDNTGNIYLTGYTDSPTSTLIASPNSHQPSFGGNNDIFLAKFNSIGTRLWATYYGGIGIENWSFCGVDNGGNVYLTGNTSTGAANIISTSCAYQTNFGGGSTDDFLCKFNSTGTRIWATYFGGAGNEGYSGYGAIVDIDGFNNIYLAGITTAATNSNVISSNSSSQPNYGGGTADGFLIKFDSCIPTPPSGSVQVCYGAPGVLNISQNCGLNWYNNAQGSSLLYSGGSFTTNPLVNDTTFWVEDISCGVPSSKAQIHVSILPSPSITISSTHTFICKGETFSITASGASTYTWATINSQSASVVLTATGSITHGVDGTGANGCKGSKTLYVQVDPCLNIDKQAKQENTRFEIFPNPSNGSITLTGNKNAQVLISNEFGQIIRRLELLESNQFKIEINDLTEGLYFVIAKADATLPVRKLIVIR